MHKRYDFLDDLNLSDDVVKRLSLSLDRTVAGSDHVVLTPLGKSLDPNQILAGWDKIFSSPTRVLNEDLMELEQSNRNKFGPRSIAVPWVMRKDGVQLGFEREQIQSNTEPGRRVVTRLTPRLRPLSLEVASKYIKNSTNSGLPYFTRKGDVLDTTLNEYDHLLHRNDPCCLFTRTQEDKKTRTVWGYPLVDVLEEMCYYRPLLEYQRRLNWRQALVGPEAIDSSIKDMVTIARDRGLVLLSIDFSTYDQTVKRTLQEYAFNYIKSLFQAGEKHRLSRIQERFGTIGLVTPDGVWDGQHGVPSGSAFTNEVDSIAQYLIASDIIDDDSLVAIQGDDGAYACTESQADLLINRFRDFGLSVNSEKSYRSDKSLVYLQKLFSWEYYQSGILGGIYPTYRALSRLVFQERFTNFVDDEISGQDFYSIRAISILENCKYHPHFRELVGYILSLDKYNLQYSKSGLNKYVKKLTETSGLEGILVNQYGDNLSGIESFETVKVIKDLL
jgi:hypothetical protein